jgi:hypothetical protein
MMINEELFERVWVSGDYRTVFCTKEEKERYSSFLGSLKEIPRGMSIVLIEKRLNKKYTKKEIMDAAPEKLKEMIK